MKTTLRVVALAAGLLQGIGAGLASEVQQTIDTPDYTVKLTVHSKEKVSYDTVALKLCNHTDEDVLVATATLIDSHINEYHFKGWFSLTSNTCQVFRGPALGQSEVNFFYHAEGFDSAWGSEYMFRLPSTRFSFLVNDDEAEYPAGECYGFDMVMLTPGVLKTIELVPSD
ncbi:DUF1036 domain-containing protein [Mesorhizobium sp.]|uniref:DUF1036 domain-containing protein n=1 Tax=Mesorhizobium sp. TaxID=1871066 RepID=UPI0025E91E4B|nr:DUF1036 domain-containing protein [Mesorhizobium sp.]